MEKQEFGDLGFFLIKEINLNDKKPTFINDLENIGRAIKNYISKSDIRVKINDTEFKKDNLNNIELNLTRENTRTNVRISNEGKINVDQQKIEQQETE